MKINIKLPDGSIIPIDTGIKAIDFIKNNIGEGLSRAAIAVKIDDQLKDLSTILEKDSCLNVITYKDNEGKEIYNHSSSHIMALAVKRLFPNVKFAIGPAIDTGFYYDFDIDRAFSEEELQAIEKEVNKIIKEDLAFEKYEMDYDKVKDFLKINPIN